MRASSTAVGPGGGAGAERRTPRVPPSLPGYAPDAAARPAGVAAELGLGAVLVKDESDRLGLPAFKVLGASWAVERALREQPARTRSSPPARATTAAPSRTSPRCAACAAASSSRARSAPARREAIAAEGAEVVVVDGDLRGRGRAAAAAARQGALIADVGDSGPAAGSSTATRRCSPRPPRRAPTTSILVPVGVGSLAAAARASAPQPARR